MKLYVPKYVCKRRKHNVLEYKNPRKRCEQFGETMTSQRESLYGSEHKQTQYNK